MISFDPGFSHTYPLRNGLTEDLIGNERVIIERLPHRNTASTPPSITYVSSEHGNLTLYHLPGDARDLTSYVSLLRSERSAANVGRLLGRRLIITNEYFGGIPNDTVIPRFSVHHASDDTTARAYQGIDMKLLPPYTRLTGELGEATNMISGELEAIGGAAREFSDVIIDSVKNGIRLVG